jgi:predicted Zn-dependent protease
VALCVAGIAASLIAYDSNRKIEDGLRTVVAGGGDASTVRELDDARTRLNPDSLRDSSKAIALARTDRAAEAERIMLDAVAREPENQLVWITLARVQATLGKRAAAQRSYLRSLALNSQTPPTSRPLPLRPGRP